MNSESTVKITLFPKPGIGIVEQIITETHPGRVNFQATYWPARLYNPEQEVTLLPNMPVTVIGRQGITLLVTPVIETGESNKDAHNKKEQSTINSQLSEWTKKFGSLFGLQLN